MADLTDVGRQRLEWDELPGALRNEIEFRLGARLVSADNAPAGFSPALAARCLLSDGSRNFIKAGSADQNRRMADMMRHEWLIARSLPAGVGAPALLDAFEEAPWVVLVYEWASGHSPRLPWASADVDAVLGAIERLADQLDPSPVPAGGVEEHMRNRFGGWERMALLPPDDLHPWARRHLSDLVELEAAWVEAARGASLLHWDIRSDNVLIDEPDACLVDWANACVGAPWLDVMAWIPSVVLEGGPAPQEILDRSPLTRAADPEAVTVMVAALAGLFLHHASLPPEPGLPRLRGFQRAQGDVALEWLRQRTGWS